MHFWPRIIRKWQSAFDAFIKDPDNGVWVKPSGAIWQLITEPNFVDDDYWFAANDDYSDYAKAALEGKDIQMRPDSYTPWGTVEDPLDLTYGLPVNHYRVAPEPKWQDGLVDGPIPCLCSVDKQLHPHLYMVESYTPDDVLPYLTTGSIRFHKAIPITSKGMHPFQLDGHISADQIDDLLKNAKTVYPDVEAIAYVSSLFSAFFHKQKELNE